MMLLTLLSIAIVSSEAGTFISHNLKCPMSSSRSFREQTNSLPNCLALCRSLESCKYASFSIPGSQFDGLCIGCKVLPTDNHVGFDAYDVQDVFIFSKNEIQLQGTVVENLEVSLAWQPASDISVTISNPRPDILAISSCGIVFTPSDWNVPQIVYLRSKVSFLNPGSIHFGLEFEGFDASSASIGTSEVQFGKQPLLYVQTPKRCFGWGSSNYRGFALGHHTFHGVGDFFMARHPEFVIQSRQARCLPSLSTSCAFGLVIKYVDSLAYVMMEDKTTGQHAVFFKGTEGGITVRSPRDGQYEFTLRNGAIVTVGISVLTKFSLHHFSMNLLLSGEVQTGLGQNALCGNSLDGIPDDRMSAAVGNDNNLFLYPAQDISLQTTPAPTMAGESQTEATDVVFPSYSCNAAQPNEDVVPTPPENVVIDPPVPPTIPPPVPPPPCHLCEVVCDELFNQFQASPLCPVDQDYYYQACLTEIYLGEAAAASAVWEAMVAEVMDCLAPTSDAPETEVPSTCDCNFPNGLCEDDGSCSCYDGYTGDKCEVEPSPSDPTPATPPLFTLQCVSAMTNAERAALKARSIRRAAERHRTKILQLLQPSSGEGAISFEVSDAMVQNLLENANTSLTARLSEPVEDSRTIKFELCLCLPDAHCLQDPVPSDCVDGFRSTFAAMNYTSGNVSLSFTVCGDAEASLGAGRRRMRRRLMELGSGTTSAGFTVDVEVPPGSSEEDLLDAALDISGFQGVLASASVQDVSSSSDADCGHLNNCGGVRQGFCLEGVCVCRHPFGGIKCDTVVNCDDA